MYIDIFIFALFQQRARERERYGSALIDSKCEKSEEGSVPERLFERLLSTQFTDRRSYIVTTGPVRIPMELMPPSGYGLIIQGA